MSRQIACSSALLTLVLTGGCRQSPPLLASPRDIGSIISETLPSRASAITTQCLDTAFSARNGHDESHPYFAQISDINCDGTLPGAGSLQVHLNHDLGKPTAKQVGVRYNFKEDKAIIILSAPHLWVVMPGQRLEEIAQNPETSSLISVLGPMRTAAQEHYGHQ